MAVLRFLASLLLLVAAVALISDLTRVQTGATKGFDPTTIARQWQDMAPASLQAAQAVVSKATHPLVWTWGVAKIINTPLFALFGGLGAVAGWLGRRRRTIEIYVN